MSDDDKKSVELIPYDPQDDNTKEITVQTDVQLAKDNIKGVIESLTPAFVDLVTIARQSQNDKYFTALSSLAKTMLDANKELIQLSKTDKEIEKISLENEAKKEGKGDNITNVNQLYVSSSEMLDQILEKLGKAEKKIDKVKKKEKPNGNEN
jgi:hypothetical protein